MTDAPPDGPATVVLDHDGFEVLAPGREHVARDALRVAVGVGLLLATFLSFVALVGGPWHGLFVLVLAAPGFAFGLAHSSGRRLLLGLRGARSVRCTPTELVVRRPGGVDRWPLADVQWAFPVADEGVRIELAGGHAELVEIPASVDQQVWLAAAIEAAVGRARRVPAAEPPPAGLRRLRERS